MLHKRHEALLQHAPGEVALEMVPAFASAKGPDFGRKSMCSGIRLPES